MDRFNFVSLFELGLRIGKEKPTSTCHAIVNPEPKSEATAWFSVKTIEKAIAAFHSKSMLTSEANWNANWRWIPFSNAIQLTTKPSLQKPSAGAEESKANPRHKDDSIPGYPRIRKPCFAW
jgi:hypothetical protein